MLISENMRANIRLIHALNIDKKIFKIYLLLVTRILR